MGLPFGLNSLQVSRIHTPEGLEVMVNLVVLVWELDVVLFDIRPPRVKPYWGFPVIPPLVLGYGLLEGLARLLEFACPLLFGICDEAIDGVWRVWVYFEQAIRAEEVVFV